MERKIEFRAKIQGTNAWIYGLPARTYTDNYIDSIIDADGNSEYIKDETLGQFTGVVDANGTKIYEGDILKLPHNPYIIEGNHQVFYYKDSFVTANLMFKNLEKANKNALTWVVKRGATVIGTIHD